MVARVEGDLDPVALDRWLGELVRRDSLDLIRMKGVLALPDDPRRFVFQAVRQDIEVAPGAAWADEPRASWLVFIGRGLDETALQQGFAACARVRPSADR